MAYRGSRAAFLCILLCGFAVDALLGQKLDSSSLTKSRGARDKKQFMPPPVVYLPPPMDYPPPFYYAPPTASDCPPPPYPPPPPEECPPPPYPPPPVECPPPPSPPPPPVECPPPPSPPPPPPPSPPPPPTCPAGCIPEPTCGGCHSKPPCAAGGCHSCGDPVQPPMVDPSPPAVKDCPPCDCGKKGGGDDDGDDDDNDLSDDDANNLNTLLSVQLMLLNIFANISAGTIRSSASPQMSVMLVDQAGSVDNMVGTMLEQFRSMSVAQSSSVASLLQKMNRIRPSNNVNVTSLSLSRAVDTAFDNSLQPQYAMDSPLKTLLAVQAYPGLAAALCTNILPSLSNVQAVQLVGGILPALAGQDAAMRTVLFSQRSTRVDPYNLTVTEFTTRINSFNANATGSSLSEDTAEGTSEPLSIVSANVFGQGIRITAQALTNLLQGVLGIFTIGRPSS